MTISVKLNGFAQASGRMRDLSKRLPSALDRAAAQQAQLIRKQMVEGLRKQAPGGKPLQQLSKLTIALRKAKGFRGTKALLRTGTLMQNISVQRQKASAYFIGVLRGGVGKNGEPVLNIAEIHEFGRTFVIRMTPKMRRWLMMMLRRTKVLNRRRKEQGESAVQQRVMVVKIVARPFIAPVIDQVKRNPAALNMQIARSLAKSVGLKFGGS